MIKIFIRRCQAPPKILLKPDYNYIYQILGKHSEITGLFKLLTKNCRCHVRVRIMNDYSHVDNETPSFAISLFPEYRNHE